MVLDVHRVDFVADLGMAFMDDWAFLAGRVVGKCLLRLRMGHLRGVEFQDPF